jgi:hypothetical protein
MEKASWNTGDVYLAATLKTLGAHFQSVSLEEGTGRWQFNFEMVEDLPKAVLAYYEKQLQVEPYSLFLNLREKRREAHAVQDGLDPYTK